MNTEQAADLLYQLSVYCGIQLGEDERTGMHFLAGVTHGMVLGQLHPEYAQALIAVQQIFNDGQKTVIEGVTQHVNILVQENPIVFT